MISPDVEIVTTTIKRYKIPSPAIWKDVTDVLHQIRQDTDLRNTSYDDTVQVIARDDEIHFEFVVAKDEKD